MSITDDRTPLIAEICRTLDAHNLSRPSARLVIAWNEGSRAVELTAAAYADAWARAWASLPSAAETVAAWQRAMAMLPSAEEAARGLVGKERL